MRNQQKVNEAREPGPGRVQVTCPEYTCEPGPEPGPRYTGPEPGPEPGPRYTRGSTGVAGRLEALGGGQLESR